VSVVRDTNYQEIETRSESSPLKFLFNNSCITSLNALLYTHTVIDQWLFLDQFIV